MLIHINIGSNIGDRCSNIERAVADIRNLAASSGAVATEVSAPVESAPWSFGGAGAFMNTGMTLRFDRTPGPREMLDLLCELKKIERKADPAPHRNEDGTYRDRSIDIDIIAAGDLVMDSGKLTLPHPMMHLRRFVLEPMDQLEPGWKHPVLGLTPAEMLERLKSPVILEPVKRPELLKRLESTYMDSFPPEERRPWHRILSPESAAGPLLRGIFNAEDGLCGLITYWDFGSFVYVEHLATDSAIRGKGLGGATLRALAAEVCGKPIVLEVEPPADSNPMAERRIAFYRRNGFEILDHPYVQPPYSDGLPSVPLLLMTTEGAPDPRIIENTLHKQVYGKND